MRIRCTITVSVATLFALTYAAAAEAQVAQPPARPFRGLFGGSPPDPNHTRQELTFGLELLGGSDDNLVPVGDQTYSVFSPRPSGNTGSAATTLRYWLGREARSVDVTGLGFMNTFRNIGLVPSYGGELRASAHTTLGRRNQVDVWQNVRYDPLFWLGAFGPLQVEGGPPIPDSNPTNSLTERRSWTVGTSALLSRHWTRRTTMGVGYGFNKRTDEGGAGFDSQTHVGSLSYQRSLSRFSSLRASYRYSDMESVDPFGTPWPVEDQTIDLGFVYGRNLSRTRRISFSGGAGAVYLKTIDRVGTDERLVQQRLQWAQSGYGSTQVDLGRTWSIAADYRRAMSVLQGVSPQPFLTDAGMLRVAGLLSERIETVLAGAYSNGRTGLEADSLRFGKFDSYTGAGQVRILVRQWWSVLAIYNHYQYRLNTVASRSLGVSPQMHRNSIRVGVTVLLPLLGFVSGAP